MKQNTQNLRPALFLDRDGTIIEDRGFLTNTSEVHFYPDSFTVLKRLQKHFALFIVTNQGGVARGLQTLKEVDNVNRFVSTELAARGIRIEETYTCPHQRSDNCHCIKPHGFYPLKAAAEYNICLEKSWSLGDHLHDVELGEKFGGRGIFLLTGHGEKHSDSLPEKVRIAANLSEAESLIMKYREQIPEHYLTVKQGAEILKQGGLVAIPTETVYGLAANGLKEESVVKIFEAKKRPFFDPLILHIASLDQWQELVTELPSGAKQLAEAFWPGPLTLVLPKSDLVPDMVSSGLETVAVRMPSHPLARRIIEESRCPLAAPSANLFGSVSPTRAIHVDRQLGDRIDGIIDGGACTVGIESTIVGYWKGKYRLLRPGGIPQEEIEKIVGPVECFKAENHQDVPAPGTMKRHYSPGTPLRLGPAGTLNPEKKRFGRLVFGKHAYKDTPHIINLSEKGNTEEAAVQLYHSLRELDKLGLEEILTDRLPDSGLGRAINDRLERASAS